MGDRRHQQRIEYDLAVQESVARPPLQDLRIPDARERDRERHDQHQRRDHRGARRRVRPRVQGPHEDPRRHREPAGVQPTQHPERLRHSARGASRLATWKRPTGGVVVRARPSIGTHFCNLQCQVLQKA